MEAVGMGVGLVSLTFQVFAGCIKGYQLLTEAKGIPQEYKFLQVRLKSEQYRLLDWGHVANLTEQDKQLLISNANRGHLIEVLDQQRRLLANFSKVDDKYRPLAVALIKDAPPDIVSGSMDAIPPAPEESNLQDRSPQTEELLKKSLDWIMGKLGQAESRDIVGKLAALNDYMRDLLNGHQLQSLSIKQTRTEFQIMQMNNKIDQLAQLFASAVMMPAAPNMQPLSPSLAFLQLRGLISNNDSRTPGTELNLATLAQTKALNSAIEHGTLNTQFALNFNLNRISTSLSDLQISPSQIRLLDNPIPSQTPIEGHRIEALYTHPNTHTTQQVWIEWKTYDPSSPSGTPSPQIEERIRRLAALLKENHGTETFRAPHCLGYFRDRSTFKDGEDPCRFGLVFEKPSGVRQDARAVSLLDLLSDITVQWCPSLTIRVKLMTCIAEMVERLHAVDWLHKGLRSENVLFFPDVDVSYPTPSSAQGSHDMRRRENLLGMPYISGFDYSRPSLAADMTEQPPQNPAWDIYRHPNVQKSQNREPTPLDPRDGDVEKGGGYRKTYDIYSLGIILLEIAYWQPIHRILSIQDFAITRPSTTLGVRNRLLGRGTTMHNTSITPVHTNDTHVNASDSSEYLSYIRSHLGDTVSRVIRTCLLGSSALGVQEEGEGERLVKGFYEEVVGALLGLRV